MASLSSCVSELKDWLYSNFLSLNLSKTETLITGPPSRIKNKTDFSSFDLDATSKFPSATVRNVHCKKWCWLNLYLLIFFLQCRYHSRPITDLDDYISKLSKAAFFQLRRIAQLNPFFSRKDAEKLVHIFNATRLDYCNALFSGLPAHSIFRLQYIQNSAARLLTSTKEICSHHSYSI